MITTASIIAVGDEVLTGEVINTNSAYLAQRLLTVGVRVRYQVVVGDHKEDIQNEMLMAISRSDLVVLIGGLGPTPDDVTRQAVAGALGRRIEQKLPMDKSRKNVALSDSSRGILAIVDASMTIEGAILWPNIGTAPGQVIRHQNTWIALLPGPPEEFVGIVDAHLVPWLRGEGEASIVRDTLFAYDTGESSVSRHLALLLHGQHPHAGIYASPAEIAVRLEGRNSDHGRVLIERAVAWARGQYPHRLYRLNGKDRVTLLMSALLERGLRVAALESLTGGMLLSRLIAWPGASQVIRGGAIVYSNEAKQKFGISSHILERFGAVSAECAKAMAEAAREAFDADIGLATTGLAGPSGGTGDCPVGTIYTAVASSEMTGSSYRVGHGTRMANRQIAVEQALSQLWQMLELPEDVT